MSELMESAARQADRAAETAGVRVRPLTELPDLRDVRDLYDGIWRRDGRESLMGLEQLRALAHTGNYVAGAYAGANLVGACVGFFAAPVGEALHSHVAGVTDRARGRSVGFALKLHQRAWSLERGLREITWTFDPLVRRNAYFNLVKLAACPREYLVDFYGALDDAVNVGQGSDRLLVAWDLAAPEVHQAAEGSRLAADPAGAPPALTVSSDGRPAPARTTGATALVDLPADIERLRTGDSDLARRWRLAVRDVLGGLMAGGARVRGFAEPGGYLVEQWSPRKLARQQDGGPS